MPIRPLVEIVVLHPYFASGVFAGARVTPEPATGARLRGLRLVAKPRAGGVTVFAEFDAAGAPKVPITAGTRLRFDVARLPQELAEATDLGPFAPGAIFTDEGLADGASGPLRLAKREARAREALAKPAGPTAIVLGGRPLAGSAAGDFTIVGPAGGVTVAGYDAAANRVALDGPAAAFTLEYMTAPARAADTLAKVEVTIGPDTVPQAAEGAPRRCTIGLQSAAARWCYHVVTDLATPLDEWRIARGNGAADGPAVSFGAAGRSEIEADDPGDAFGTDLWRRSEPQRVLRFISDAPAACSETVARRVGLFAGDAQLYAALPNPSPAQRRRIGGQEAFGEVLRIVTG